MVLWLVGGGDTLTLNQLEAFTKKENQAIRYYQKTKHLIGPLFKRQGQSFFDDVKKHQERAVGYLVY